jgi:hypothetical protein
MRAYYRDDLRVYLDIYMMEGPLDIFGEGYQDAQVALFRVVDLRRRLLHIRRMGHIVPRHLRALRDPAIDRLLGNCAEEVTTVERDIAAAERLLNRRFQGLSIEEQHNFWNWYENDMKACGFQKVGEGGYRYSTMPNIVTRHN